MNTTNLTAENAMTIVIKLAAQGNEEGAREVLSSLIDQAVAHGKSETNGLTPAQLKAHTVEFYQWWHNQPGTNTEQAYDAWRLS